MVYAEPSMYRANLQKCSTKNQLPNVARYVVSDPSGSPLSY